jgi:hypothetical protein
MDEGHSFGSVSYNPTIFILSALVSPYAASAKLFMNQLTYIIYVQERKLIQLSSGFFGGFIVAFTGAYLLTLVMLTSLPLTTAVHGDANVNTSLSCLLDCRIWFRFDLLSIAKKDNRGRVAICVSPTEHDN